MGKHYFDELLCDAIDMEAWHLLLGRLWQFSKNAPHKGQENSYTFHWKGKTVVLLPLKDKQSAEAIIKAHKPVHVTLTESEMNRELQHCDVC